MAPDVSVIIVNWNTRDLLLECISSLHDTISDLTFDVWVVDNASADGSVETVRDAFPAARLIANSQNVGFARANNQAMARCQGRYMLLFNSDAVALPGSVYCAVLKRMKNEFKKAISSLPAGSITSFSSRAVSITSTRFCFLSLLQCLFCHPANLRPP